MTNYTPRHTLIASAPTRLDFGGGWTDVPPFPEDRGGFVCNLAIDRRATVTIVAPPSSSALISASTDSDLGLASNVPLVRAALSRAAREAHFPAIESVSLSSDFPVGAGLGGSSAAGVALAAACAAHQGRVLGPQALAEWSRAVEVEEMGVAGGRQDHYAAAYGGALGITFATETTAERIALAADTIQLLESRCLLVYTGESRISGTTISAVLDAYRNRESRVLHALDRMKTLAMYMRDALANGDIDALAALVDEHWTHQRSLHPGITTPRIDALENSARRAGATGVKALGASGGGCVIVFAPGDSVAHVGEALSEWGTLLPWTVAPEGVRIKVRQEVRED